MGIVGGGVDFEGFAVDFVWLGGFEVLVGRKIPYSSLILVGKGNNVSSC